MSILSLLAGLLLSLTPLEQGEKLFLENKPEAALPYLEKALFEDPHNERIYNYVGIVYEQLGDWEKAIQVYRRGLNAAETIRDLLYLNMGNNHFRLQQYTLAEEMYSKALEINGQMADAYLNRAQARLELENYPAAREDYVSYLRMDPLTPQRENIEKIIALLGSILEEQERLRQEELARQKELLNEVLSTLQNASEDTRNLSAGSEGIQEEYEEIDIAD
ncbi:MAG: tetratricopeptide repeat protein [Spirochaetales bacterium]|nr:tetratricopeptide repeat protein [Spirochaetales bacterium]